MGYERDNVTGYIITKKIKEDMIDLYEHGDSLQSIADYFELPYESVREIIKKETGYYTDKHPIHNKNSYDKLYQEKIEKRKETLKKQKADVVALYKEGKTVEEIVDIVKSFTITEIRKILHDKKLISDEEYDKCISDLDTDQDRDLRKMKSIEEFKKSLKVGDRYSIRTSPITQKTVTIEKIYPHIVQTDKGCFRINDLLIGKKIK